MDLSIVITHYRDTKLLNHCLESLEGNLDGILYEIFVVLSEYQPEILKKLKQDYPEVNFLPFEENLYFVRSVNKGLQQAQGEFVLIINDDVVITKNSVSLLIEFLKNNKKVGLVGPKILYPNGREQYSCFRFYTPLTIVCRRTILGRLIFCKKLINQFLYGDKNLNREDGVEVDWLTNGAGILTRRKYLEKIGFLDERFKHYFSDVDWCRRFWENGYSVVYFPKAVFYHHHRRSSATGGVTSILTNKMTRIHIRDGIKYFFKWGLKIPKAGSSKPEIIS